MMTQLHKDKHWTVELVESMQDAIVLLKSMIVALAELMLIYQAFSQPLVIPGKNLIKPTTNQMAPAQEMVQHLVQSSDAIEFGDIVAKAPDIGDSMTDSGTTHT